MFIKEIDLFKGMGMEVIDEIFQISAVESYSSGHILFKQGDPAHNFYLLEQGEIKLTIGEEGRLGFIMSPGDAFGWSSMVDRDVYTATAECKLPSKLIKIETDKLDKIFEKYPASGLIFFRHLARVMGERLIRAYDTILSAYKGGEQPSYG
jgi:CRP/FNR family cyclic AMP-dependent transcriptional regulator